MAERILARAVIALALVLGVAALPSARRAVEEHGRAADLRMVDGVTVIDGMPDGTLELIQRVRRELPEREPLRIVNAAGVCRRLSIAEGQGTVYWLQYQLLPRPMTCDPQARWSLYIRMPEAALPRRGTRIPAGQSFVLVRREDGER